MGGILKELRYFTGWIGAWHHPVLLSSTGKLSRWDVFNRDVYRRNASFIALSLRGRHAKI